MLEKIDPGALAATLGDFFHSYIVDTVSGSFRVFQSFTYGEMLISLLLFTILLLLTFRWIFDVLR
ncbi:hypothetical protein ERICII_04141 (plasmid) [Paenibacillus larvae subsp. larvae DSM 25430]|jgi:hypothetical protein|uniref:Uncharacterized protein n=1 Tax=Paenibacillus larvae subsp. larvae DSM 25430 TaxID=697284 RepID=V9WD82_9BACL|nr:hypothetical protein ERIC2_10p00050 [Paenibacillus larvae subsp. larvae DSM 25430]AVG14369.1 hypothetical protein ERICII_04141 [Paenibacillus larvae subsp. larvae DSM 25430]